MSFLRIALLSLCVGALGACKQDPLAEFVRSSTDAGPASDSDLGVLSDGPHGEGQLPDGSYKDKCVSSAGGEVCNGLDDDCNGKVDDVDPTRLATDGKNCGQCGKVCSFDNALAKCQGGKCVLDSCAPGYWDINKDDKDGCEYACLPTNGGKELCDTVDNDCDGKVDNGFDLQKDVNNCGTCGTVCQPNHTTASCAGGKCVITKCDDQWADINKDATDGCEYKCPQWPVATSDPCDGVDNNCNGKIDEDFVAGSACYNSVSGCDVKTGQCKGECKLGTASCPNGYVICANEAGPSPEICDGLDNDCDGTADNGFDKLNDPRYCGGCNACNIPHAIAGCQAGKCMIAICELGWVDLDKDLGTGCEYKCTPTGPEICDGIDNDCNGLTDTKDPGMAQLGANPCFSAGACAGATATCQGSSGWICGYGPDVELKKCGGTTDCGGTPCVGGLCSNVVAAQETLCDNKDNNCNGLTDETFLNKSKPCGEPGKKGICQGTGTWQCDGTGTALTCNITKPGSTAQNELCNGLDDDCDGLVDEGTDNDFGNGFLGVHDAMVHVNRSASGKSYNFYIYAFEASRPDASASASGVNGDRSCSKSGVLPWSSVTYTEAAGACAASGKRLCTHDEWQVACQGPSTTLYPYGAAYQAQSCNGLDHAVGAPVATGSMQTCAGGDPGMFDMSGNVREWTSEQAGTTDPPSSKPIYVVRGGAYHTPSAGLTCSFTLSLAVVDVALPAIGFRCCSDTPP
jgi:hypothetical protein